jgi:outer membrane protein
MLRRLFSPCLAVVLVCACTVRATSEEANPDQAPVLTLDEALQIALANNRPLKIAGLEVDKAKWQLKDTRTKNLPAFQTYLFASGMLTSPSFTFERGSLGDFNGSPIPTQDIDISLSHGVSAYVVAQVTQPLTQLYKIHLGVRMQELATDLSNEKFRAERQSTVRDVKQAYYAVQQSQSSLQAQGANVKQYEETDRVVLQYVSQEAVLKSDSMDVKAKLAQERYKLVQLQNTLQTQKEQLNLLLGRELNVAFRVQTVPPESAEETDLKFAQQTALSRRSEIRQAELTIKQAEYDRRLAKAQYIPDVGVAVHYLSPFKTELLPKNVLSAGVEFSWEPWDWGRRKDDMNAKQAVLDQSQYQLKEAQSKVLVDVNNRFRKLGEARLLLSVTGEAQAAATERMREVTNKYEQKTVLLRDLLQQQAALAGASSDYQQALVGFWDAQAEFEKAMGED